MLLFLHDISYRGYSDSGNKREVAMELRVTEQNNASVEGQVTSGQECPICPECGELVMDRFDFRNKKGERVHEDCWYPDKIGGEFSGFFRFTGLFQGP